MKPEDRPIRWLCIPTTPETWIPLGMSPGDFDLMLATIDLWKSKILAPLPASADLTTLPQQP